ncbi:MAG TPA: hypothetical protein VGL94_02775 [Ktedonobacteraceae bacterium]
MKLSFWKRKPSRDEIDQFLLRLVIAMVIATILLTLAMYAYNNHLLV